MRQPNELLVSRELMKQLFARGEVSIWRVHRGPEPEATIVGARMVGDVVVLEYDRPVEEVAAARMPGGATRSFSTR